jgi:hypothetical protein
MTEETALRIAAALERLADTVFTLTLGTGQLMPASFDEPDEPEAEPPSIDEVRQALIKVGPRGREILNAHGAAKLSELEVGKYASVIRAAS